MSTELTPAAERLKPEQLAGFQYFSKVRTLLRSLHGVRAHPNRVLHYDEHISLLLLYYFNPIITSLRDIQRASEFERVQRTLKIQRASLGSLSEASAVFDYRLLQKIFDQLAAQPSPSTFMPRPKGVPPELRILAADGTLWEALPRMAWALWQAPLQHGVKGHVQFDVIRQLPVSLEVSNGNGNERQVLQQQVQPGTLNLIDRGYFKYELYQDILDAGSSFVARVKDDLAYHGAVERSLSADDRKAGVYFDAVVELTSDNAKVLKQKLRLVKVRVVSPPPCNLHPLKKRGKHKAYDREVPLEQDVWLLTDLLDLPAESIALVYRYRWHIEVFFRWLKCVLGCRHLLAESKNGVRLQLYTAFIACLLVMLWTECKPNKALLMTLQFYLSGWASEEELNACIRKLKPLPA
jgi:hypothetical protein